jgi:hypothetical protein
MKIGMESECKIGTNVCHNLYSSPNVIKEYEMGMACSIHGGKGIHIGFWWEG